MESRLIHNILDSVHGVMSVDVMVVTKMVAVHHDPAAISPAALVAALNSAGLQASLNKHSTSGGQEPPAAAGACSSGCCGSTLLPHSSPWQQQPLQQRSGVLRLLASLRDNKSLPPLSVMASGLLLLINLLLLLPGMPTPGLLQKGLLALIAAAVAVPPVLRKAYMGLKNRNLDMNSLVSKGSGVSRHSLAWCLCMLAQLWLAVGMWAFLWVGLTHTCWVNARYIWAAKFSVGLAWLQARPV